FACEHENVEPDLMCLGKGLSGGYLPLAATLATDEVAEAFEGEPHEHRTLYHGHTYTGNPLGCAAALASLRLFDENDLLESVRRKATVAAEWLEPLRDPDRFAWVVDVRQRGLMVGIELSADGTAATGFDPSRPLGAAVTDACRKAGLIIRPLGNVVVLMPPLSIDEAELRSMIQLVLDQIERLPENAVSNT
ncbi:MAG: aminotransferase class III-fold pyridoxal phosphate-dependent enzyme, partial [Phycisphaeraceae bacterium]|nr:aminotransferase class III-fold pyridoxal phosphate-dependent enzyme [Phycisphaeraceae bacterium]